MAHSNYPNNGSSNNATASLEPPLVDVTIPWHYDNTTATCAIHTHYGIVASCIAIAFFLFGILLTFFGYRFFKAIMFLTGFIFGSVLVYMIMLEQKLLPPEGNMGIAAGAGILLGLITMLVQVVGLFMTGFNLGTAEAAVILVIVEQITHPPSKWIPIGVLLFLGVTFGTLTLRCQKGLTIVSTSIIGAALALAGVDYFIELSKMALYIWDRVMAFHSSDLCWFSWLVLGLWPFLAIAGILVQWKVTGMGIDHKLALRSHREQGANLQQERAVQRRETQQTRYRHLYQARRVKGDVISQNFVQTIQHKLSPAMRSLTALNSDSANEEESTATTTLTQIT